MEGYVIKDENVYLVKDREEKFISKAMEITKINKNIDSNKISANIKYKSIGGYDEIVVNRDEYLNKNNLIKLQSKGLGVNHDNVTNLVKYFEACENDANIQYVHENLGFKDYNNTTIYRLNTAIGIDSRYIGGYDVSKGGSRKTYIDMLQKEVIGKCELEFCLISSLSAVILGYIGKDSSLDSLIIHLSGNSTTGKSTALKLAISLFGYPDNKKKGLYGTYNGTNNALISKLTGLNGVPYAIDEISMSSSTNFTKFIYTLANGNDKDRLNKESELKESKTWLTTILSNGERSLVDSANKNAGIAIRVIEANNFVWTKDSENSENINKIIIKNYGHIGIEFAEYVLNLEKDKVIEGVEEQKDEIKKYLQGKNATDEMSDRRCSKYAVLLQTAYLFQDMMNLSLDIKGIMGMMLKIEMESIRKRNFEKSAIEYIKQYISKYKNKFNNGKNQPNDVLGKIISKNGQVEVQMNKISFNEMLRGSGFEEPSVVLKELKKGGYLNCEKDRYTRTRKGDLGYNEEVYVIKLQ